MKQYKHHKLNITRNLLLVFLAVAAVTAGGRYGKTMWKSAQGTIVPAASAHERWQANYGKLPLSFEVNRGQAPKPVEFLARGDGYNMALLPGEAVLNLSKQKADAKTGAAKNVSTTLQIKLVGANKAASGSGMAALSGKSNYLIGNDSTKWQTDVPTFAKVKYEAVYPGVDAIFYGNQRQLEYDFIVAPGADPKAIRLEFSGAKSVKLNDQGELVLATAAGEVRQHRPVIYQEINGARQTIEGGYKLKDNQATFELGAYDTNYSLVIDPVISYVTFLGESKDVIKAIAVDAQGNVYLTGMVVSANYPITDGIVPFGEPLPQQAQMLSVTKLNGTGTQVVYSTMISGTKGFKSTPTSQEAVGSIGFGIAVDAQGNASVGGQTTTTNFPTTFGAYRTTFSSSSEDRLDSFVLRLNAVGNQLLASTLVGGNGTDTIAALALDGAGNFCVVGNTNSTDLLNSDSTIGKREPGQAIFVAKVSADATTLIHSNVLDAGGNDVGKAIATDAAGNIYITGTTPDGIPANSAGTRFPRTQGAFQFPDVTVPGWVRPTTNAFIAKFAPNGSLVFSSVLGTARPTGIAVDRDGNPWITGWSSFLGAVGIYGQPGFQSFETFPRTHRTTVMQDSETFGPVGSGEMLTKLNAAGTQVLLSHQFGFPSDEIANGLAIDAQGFIHITGYATAGFVTPDGPIQLEDLVSQYYFDPNMWHHAFHLKFSPDGVNIVDANFLRSTQGNAITVDPAGNAYILGWAGPGFVPPAGALQTKLPQAPQLNQPVLTFIAKLGNGVNPGVTPTPVTPTPTPEPAFHTISGRVTDYAGKPMSAVPIALTGTAAASARTDGSGYFSFRNLRDEGVYRVMPLQRGPTINFKTYYPNPGWQEFDGLGKDVTANFSYSLTSPWVPPNSTPTPTPTPAITPTPTPPVTQDSTLINPKFDQGSMGWTTSGYVSFTNALAKLLPTSSLTPASVGQWVNVTPGATYDVTADVAASSTARSTFAVTFDNGGSGGAVAFNNVQAPRTFHVVFTVPAGVTQARIYVQANGSASASSWATADNFTLTRVN